LKEYQAPIFAKKGVMSKTVTLTYPYNPFNQVANEPLMYVKTYHEPYL